MQENNRFEDLVLDNNQKKNKQKQLLFKAIMLIIVLLVLLIIFKILSNSSDNKTALPPIEPNVEFEQKSQENEVFENLKSENDGFSDDFSSLEERLKKENNIVDIEPKKSQEVQNVVKELAKANESIKPIEESIKIDEPKTIAPKPAAPIAQAPQAPKPAPKPTPKVEQKAKVESSVFDSLNVAKPSVAPKPAAPAKAATPSVSTQGSFIQVYASRNLDLKSHEIKKLDNLGLQYKVVTDANGMGRVIVGPYSNADKANALKFIRENVKKDAFFYHAK